MYIYFSNLTRIIFVACLSEIISVNRQVLLIPHIHYTGWENERKEIIILFCIVCCCFGDDSTHSNPTFDQITTLLATKQCQRGHMNDPYYSNTFISIPILMTWVNILRWKDD